jgi:MFS transporter, DHA2 family, multidrug resistance protein
MFQAPPSAANVPPPTVKTWIGFGVLCLGMFMAILDVQVVATSLPTMQVALKMQKAQMSWLQTAYLIAEVITIPLTGLLTRALTIRWLFTCAILVFTAASVGCAMSTSFTELVVWRVVQGCAAGPLIPTVFTSVFLMFPANRHAIATGIGGVLAVLAPTVGCIAGGWITTKYSWPWLFLINVPAGLFALSLAPAVLPRGAVALTVLKRLDWLALTAIAIALAALEIGLKEAPHQGWLGGLPSGLFALAVLAGVLFIYRSLTRASPIADLANFGHRSFAIGCTLNFVLGIGLFGSVYLLPVFLGLVRGLSALQIGQIMLVTGVAQLISAPIAVTLERRLDPRLLTAFGFALFATGLAMGGNQTTKTGASELFWSQIIRGSALMFCLLPATRIALSMLPAERIPDASALFNLMRNLGGAIGLALIDTVLFGRAPMLGEAMAVRLKAGDYDAARTVGIPLRQFRDGLAGGIDAKSEQWIRGLVEQWALTTAANEAWTLCAVLTAAALLAVPFCKLPAAQAPVTATPTAKQTAEVV